MKCEDCANYTNNKVGAWKKGYCEADMKDDVIEWFVSKDPGAECHRPHDYKPIGG